MRSCAGSNAISTSKRRAWNRRYRISTGVPIGIRRTSRSIAELSTRMHPWEDRPGISWGWSSCSPFRLRREELPPLRGDPALRDGSRERVRKPWEFDVVKRLCGRVDMSPRDSDSTEARATSAPNVNPRDQEREVAELKGKSASRLTVGRFGACLNAIMYSTRLTSG